ncbi:MAG: hypothetical protein B7Z55_00680, partial [Planctomycetales bacterium 12-60-4]
SGVREVPARRTATPAAQRPKVMPKPKLTTPRDWERTIVIAVVGLVLATAVGLGIWIVNAQQPNSLKADTVPRDSASTQN